MVVKTKARRTGDDGAADERKPRYWLRRVVVLGGVGLAFGILLFGIYYAFAKVPEPQDIATAQSSVVEDHKGRFVGRLHGSEDRAIVPLKQIPEITRNAVIAAEDRGFYQHKGISPLGVVRAAVRNLMAREIKQGGSTITQQYVKNAFVGRERSFMRKFKEAVVSVKLERKWSKDQILSAYLNTIYFGRGAYGIDAAARAYYGIPASRLNLAQSALLAGIVRAPEKLEPAKNAEAAKKIRDRVLDGMAEMKMIEETARDEAKKAELATIARGTGISGRGAYFLDAVRRELIERFGEDEVLRGGLRIRTTMDVEMQKTAEEAVAGVLDRATDPEAALVSVDPATGEIRAYVGGRDYAKQQFDLAAAKRQPGSSFKPLVLAAALENGSSLSSAYPAPATITLQTGGKPWTVSNYDKKSYGTLNLAAATADSVNTVYAQLIMDIGPEKVVEVAERLGIESKLDAVPSLALGTLEISPSELAGAYATMANDGKRVAAHMIARVTDRDGKELYRFSDSAKKEMEPNVARNVTQAMVQVVKAGTGRSADIGRPMAGKTGTTENHRDAWFAGYTPNLATVVWMGYPDGTRTMSNVRGKKVVGGSFPAQIWKAFMKKAHSGVKVKSFPGAEPIAPSGEPAPSPSGSQTAVPTGPPVTVVPEPTGTGSPSHEPPPSPAPTPTQSRSRPPSPSPSPTPTSTNAQSSPSPGGGTAAA
ncbi:MAG TPA: transglycosylase domain-containing protein [Actinomycetota bacterium]|nr:transglycosylase domain-containing protein [Actinomycetota bacterium]